LSAPPLQGGAQSASTQNNKPLGAMRKPKKKYWVFLPPIGKLFAALGLLTPPFAKENAGNVSARALPFLNKLCRRVMPILAGQGPKDADSRKEDIMKSFLLFIAVLCAVTLSSSSVPSVTNAANAAKKERAVMNFDRPVELLGVTLKGEYLFVHDDMTMVHGEACTFVYKGLAELPKNLVVSFHCLPAVRDKVAFFF